MILRVIHTTTYSYGNTVSLCHTEVLLTPRNGHGQTLIEHELAIEPDRRNRGRSRTDFFGNAVSMFSHRGTASDPAHRRDAAWWKCTRQEPIHPALTPPWEQVREVVQRHQNGCHLRRVSIRVRIAARRPRRRNLQHTERPRFRPAGRCSKARSTSAIASSPISSTIATRPPSRTPVDEALHSRHGVCQDFAHVMIGACDRSGLPARYVSGYLRTGGDGIGAHASHAWLSVFCPGFGWLDLDPTNDVSRPLVTSRSAGAATTPMLRR